MTNKERMMVKYMMRFNVRRNGIVVGWVEKCREKYTLVQLGMCTMWADGNEISRWLCKWLLDDHSLEITDVKTP
jgi:hypothetical protein